MKINEIDNTYILTELTGIKQYVNHKDPDEALEEISDMLSDIGYEFVGEGTYGLVMAKPNAPFIVKIFSTWDHCYKSFVDYAVKNKSPHVPVYKTGKIRALGKEMNAVRVERLEPTTLPISKELFLERVITKILNEHPSYQDIVTKYQSSRYYDEFESFIADFYNIYNSMPQKCMNDVEIGSDNIMQRPSTGELVINDPWI